MEMGTLLDLAVGLFLTVYGLVFLVGAIRRWEWLVGPFWPLPARWWGRDHTRLLVLVLGALLAAIGLKMTLSALGFW